MQLAIYLYYVHGSDFFSFFSSLPVVLSYSFLKNGKGMGIGIGIGIGNIIGYGTKIIGGGNSDEVMVNGQSGGGGGGGSFAGVLLLVVCDCVNAGDLHNGGVQYTGECVGNLG